MDRVKAAFGNRGMTFEAARQCEKDLKEWRALVHMYVTMSFTRLFFLDPVFFRTALRALMVITWRGVGCRYMMQLG